ncbi:CPBP family intramembrane glutamic endopeptidase [Clostridium scatologenes]|uniref:CAAX amino terminal protease family protein n=1 Tax=Clostridium scatologenes TaxID=1548 RepID=A0A0E3JNW0_CLOSL|nr:type II CAAX endopeptidase family protein [Clostridium scatologenes]AKA69704.1 CAAX amino terminal protease family protein [Clostridium scatologenes]
MKNNIDYLKQKHTFILCILITVVYLAVLKGIGWVISFSMRSHGYGLELIVEFIGVTVSLIIISLVGKKHIFKEKGVGVLRGLFIGGFLVFIGSFTIFSSVVDIIHNKNVSQLLPISQILMFVAAMAGVGMSEEFIFRGTILNLFIDKFGRTPKGIYAAIISSSTIFGIAHITNVFSGVLIKSAFIQAIGAGVLGALLAAIYVRSKNIWVVAILHAFIDFSALISSGFFGTNSIASEINSYGYIKLFGCLIYLIPVVFLLRKKKLLEILNNE